MTPKSSFRSTWSRISGASLAAIALKPGAMAWTAAKFPNSCSISRVIAKLDFRGRRQFRVRPRANMRFGLFPISDFAASLRRVSSIFSTGIVFKTACYQYGCRKTNEGFRRRDRVFGNRHYDHRSGNPMDNNSDRPKNRGYRRSRAALGFVGRA